jgi:hypothetical protein
MAIELKTVTGRGADQLLVELKKHGISKENLVTIIPGNGSRVVAFYWGESKPEVVQTAPEPKRRGRPPKETKEETPDEEELDEII